MEEAEREKALQRQQQIEDLKQTRHLYIQMTKDILKLPEVRTTVAEARFHPG